MRGLISLWINSWRLFRLYFFSEERFYARSMLLILIIMELISVGLNIVFTYWYNAFLNKFQSYDQSGFFRILWLFCPLAFGIISVSVYKNYLSQSLQLYWRRWLTDYFLKKYLSHDAFYTLSLQRNHAQAKNHGVDNPDQRISMDINTYTECVINLLIGALNSFASLISFVILLWSLSGVVTINVTRYRSFHIHGGMVWVALVYAGLGKNARHIHRCRSLKNEQFLW